VKHVLIMEDNALLANDWRGVFELNGHKVTLTHNGDAAIAHLETTEFDLVITDLFVPNAKGGLHVIGKLMTMKARMPPTIAVTGERRYTDDPKEKNYFLRQTKQLGVSATIEKPFAPAELLLMADEFWSREDKKLS